MLPRIQSDTRSEGALKFNLISPEGEQLTKREMRIEMVDEAKDLGDANSDRKTERGLWQYVETPHAAEVKAGDIVLRPHWKGVIDAGAIRDVVALAAAAPTLYDAVKSALEYIEATAKDIYYVYSPEAAGTVARCADTTVAQLRTALALDKPEADSQSQ